MIENGESVRLKKKLYSSHFNVDHLANAIDNRVTSKVNTKIYYRLHTSRLRVQYNCSLD
jgi:hypothetical protein